MARGEIKNAVIESVKLSFGERGILELWIGLDYGGMHQCFGGYALYLPKSWRHHSINTCAGHFIYRTLEVAGVTDFDALIGRTIRVDSDWGRVYGIGHIVKEDWFYPEDDLREKSINETVEPKEMTAEGVK